MTIPIRGTAKGNPDLAYARAMQRGAQRPAFLHAYLTALYHAAEVLGLDGDVLVAQADLETDSFRSDYYLRDGNVAGFGAFDDGSNLGLTFTPQWAGIAHASHMGAYAGVDVPPEWIRIDPRWQAVADAGYVGTVTTIDDLGNGRWATDESYGSKLRSRYTAYWGEPEQEPAMANAKLHVILIAGHNSVGDGGNPTERALTPKLAAAYLATFRKAGISTEWINPTMFAGGLDGLALATARAIRDADADLVLALDLHFNGSRSGVHTIVAHNRTSNGAMLNSGYVQGRVAADVAENNTLDMTMASAFSKAIVAANPGMYLWDADGVMLETQTGVGLPLSKGGRNSRLAMMAASAPYRDKSVRVTIEHGGTDDAKREDFYNRCAGAALAAVKTVLADRLESGNPEPTPDPEPEPPTGDPGSPTLPAFLFGEANGYSFDPSGPVSKLWLKNSNETHHWPRLVDVLEASGRRLFVFADGSVITTDLKGGAPSYLYDPIAA
jgi:hypothetical protein